MRLTLALALILAIISSSVFILLLESKTHIFAWATEKLSNRERPEPFPVSVNFYTQRIDNKTQVDEFFSEYLAQSPNSTNHWWNKVAAKFSTKEWYQNLASPVGRIVVIWPGERKEEIIGTVSKILDWDQSEQREFQMLMDSSSPIIPDGKYFPGQYVIHEDAKPIEVKNLIYSSFEREILNRYTSDVSDKVPLEKALIIASLLEREASDFDNMREISGVIWNRIFIDMPLQLDATLQYVRGSKTYEAKWWPIVNPQDKYIESPYNTYQNKNLPPAPISNPSTEAVLAALNPSVTDCLYYFHTSAGDYLCSADYKEHVSKLQKIYGRGS